MDHNDQTTKNRKCKHLPFAERVKIGVWLEEGYTCAWIAKKLGRSKTTIGTAVERGMTEQIPQGRKVVVYLADRSQAVYEENRKNSVKPFKALQCF